MSRLMIRIFFFGVALAFFELNSTTGTQSQENPSSFDTIKDYLLTWSPEVSYSSPKWKRAMSFVIKTPDEAQNKRSVLKKFHNYLITLRSLKMPHLPGLRSPSSFHQNSEVR
ncbi:uncharacterized protein LOC111085510 isoform X2 [Limulus polyphemus]|uniref:Uncharacterized protein LOC111085510 isoform X2 n=1 Tax=Limulus polyphemus TaxID=6850 RepID=A0ABM1S920_LIMPO|nr:uncharacterized protein LOC111085510 isoform X2 [Limulus polyphemus]